MMDQAPMWCLVLANRWMTMQLLGLTGRRPVQATTNWLQLMPHLDGMGQDLLSLELVPFAGEIVCSQLPPMQDLALMYEWVAMPQAPRMRLLLQLCALNASHEQGVL